MHTNRDDERSAEVNDAEMQPNAEAIAVATKPDWRAAITLAERQALCRIRNGRACITLAANWVLVFAALALVAWAPNPLTVVVALFVIGARQLGMAVIMHEAAHRTLFRQRRLNDWAGNWLGAYPIWASVDAYRPYHLKHHAKNWSAEDPDLHLATPFPITAASFRRKVLRDLTGRTGLKFARFSAKRDAGIFMAEGQRRRDGGRALRGMLITNAALLLLLTLAGHPLLYLLWPAAWLTTYTLVTRFRSIAEHSMVRDAANELQNTRTTVVRWWERLLLAPNRVNFHLEHHLLMTVPHYNLPKMHRLLRARGVLDQALVARGYLGVLRLAASKPA
jgi:fatty acid desaturase